MRTHVARRLITLRAVTVIHLSLQYTAPLNLVYYERAAGEQPPLAFYIWIFSFMHYFYIVRKDFFYDMMIVHMRDSVHLRGTFMLKLIHFC